MQANSQGCARREGGEAHLLRSLSGIYEALVTFLDATMSPDEYPNLAPSGGSQNWDGEAKVKKHKD